MEGEHFCSSDEIGWKFILQLDHFILFSDLGGVGIGPRKEAWLIHSNRIRYGISKILCLQFESLLCLVVDYLSLSSFLWEVPFSKETFFVGIFPVTFIQAGLWWELNCKRSKWFGTNRQGRQFYKDAKKTSLQNMCDDNLLTP